MYSSRNYPQIFKLLKKISHTFLINNKTDLFIIVYYHLVAAAYPLHYKTLEVVIHFFFLKQNSREYDIFNNVPLKYEKMYFFLCLNQLCK